MVCFYCGKAIREGAKFCPSCGTELSGVTIELEKNIVEMKRRKPIVLWIGVALVFVIATVIISVYIISRSSGKSYDEKMDLGRKYLSEFDYEQAKLAFEEAIKIDPKRKDAYLELAKVYVKEGKPEESLKILKEAEKKVDESDKKDIAEKRKEIEDEIEKTNFDEKDDDFIDLNDSVDETPNTEKIDTSEEGIVDEDEGKEKQNDEFDYEADNGNEDNSLEGVIFKKKKESYKVEARKISEDDIIGISRAYGEYYLLEGNTPQIEEINSCLKEDAERAIHRIPDDFNVGGYSLTYKIYDWPENIDYNSLVDSIYYYVYSIKQIDDYVALDIVEGCYVGEKDYSLMYSLKSGKQVVNITEVSAAESIEAVYEQVVDALKRKGYSDADVNSVIWSLDDFIMYDEGNNTWWSMTDTNDIMIRIGYYSDMMTDVVIPSKFNIDSTNDEKNKSKDPNEEADKAYMEQLKKICKKHMEEDGSTYIEFDYILKDIDGDGVHEAIFVRYRSGMYLYSYEDGKIKDLFPNWGHIIDELVFYPETETMIHVYSNHGGERYDYYQMKDGEYVIITSKVRRTYEDGPWIYYNEKDEEITGSEFEYSVSKLVKGFEIVVLQNEFMTYYYSED